MALKKKEKELLAQAVMKPSILKSADPDILKNSLFFMEAAVQNPDVLKYADKKITQNWDIADYIIRKNGMAYRYFNREIKGDFGFALDAIKNTAEIIPYIHKSAQKEIHKMYSRGKHKVDKNLALFFAQTVDSYLGEYIGKYMDDKDVMMVAVAHYPLNFKYASDRLKGDIDLIKATYKANPYLFESSPFDEYKKLFIGEREFVLEVMRENDSPFISSEYADDEEVVRTAVAKEGVLIRYASARLREDKDFILEILANRQTSKKYEPFSILAYLSEDFRDDKEIVAACAMENASEYKHASEKVKSDADFALELMMNMGIDLYEMLTPEVKSNKDVVAFMKRKELEEKYF